VECSLELHPFDGHRSTPVGEGRGSKTVRFDDTADESKRDKSLLKASSLGTVAPIPEPTRPTKRHHTYLQYLELECTYFEQGLKHSSDIKRCVPLCIWRLIDIPLPVLDRASIVERGRSPWNRHGSASPSSSPIHSSSSGRRQAHHRSRILQFEHSGVKRLQKHSPDASPPIVSSKRDLNMPSRVRSHATSSRKTRGR
jgi:hypothetical protein